MNKILITGSSGFVGQNLVPYLVKKEHYIDTLSLRKEDWQNSIPTTTEVIIHLAGKAHDTANTSSADEYFRVNRDLTIELFNHFIKSDAKDFFYFSSVKAVADTVEGVLKEDVIPNPYTPYGKSKQEAEQYLLKASLPEDKRVFIIRPCMIHGPGNKGNLNLLYKVVEKGIPWPLASFDNHRSFLSIDNLCYLVNEMMQNTNVSSGVYNFSDDKALSTNELVTLIANVSNKKPKLWHISKGFMNSIASIGDKIKLPLNSERLKKLTENYVVSNDKVKEALGIDKLPVSAEEGLERTLRSFAARKA
ncbi:NAD-dependent epimerase/dehydratase family protein [Myroides odoratimimus]|uniref:NAD-dependent epimerase/dehydratase family protein n=2 Tax=Myroides odoratimimus TaxID=76832 RepID=UPI002575F1AD|nr:NAD-dependent epimerase/dehydratase family protein [Myroides odoratimimus]MDM1506880.1 NAD-dependent epimerase/dehydratase family protein [Myroides odoratimimus]MDM1537768.1 NAD-dependent epimerase/dehydratase family protein [Myroides odoratimimus]MDM1677321.1 NAD-dependent epimerase/dehydratase family protein [Myroides odoratimimus]